MKKNSNTVMKHSYFTTESNKYKLNEECNFLRNVYRITKAHKCLLTLRDGEQDADKSVGLKKPSYSHTVTLFTYEKSVVDLLKGKV